jgi:MEKHLA domain
MSIWKQPEIICWSQILANSFQRLLNDRLIANSATPEQLAEALFHAPFVVVSHGTQPEPILNYGNQAALRLWDTSWDKFTQTPSRLTAETVNQATRAKMLEQAAKQGYIANYCGVRISSTGQRFLIKAGIIWNLTDESGKSCGQAATFSEWNFLEA